MGKGAKADRRELGDDTASTRQGSEATLDEVLPVETPRGEREERKRKKEKKEKKEKNEKKKEKAEKQDAATSTWQDPEVTEELLDMDTPRRESKEKKAKKE